MPMWFSPPGMHKWKFVISNLQSEKHYILKDDSQRTQGPTGQAIHHHMVLRVLEVYNSSIGSIVMYV